MLRYLLGQSILSLALVLPAIGQDFPEHLKRQSAIESKPLNERQPIEDFQKTAHFWYDSRNPAHLGAMDRALKILMPKARQQAPLVKDFETWEEAQKHRDYHDAGAVLLAKCYTLLYYTEIEKAEPCIRQLCEEFPYAMLLSSDRRVTWARKALRYHVHVSMMYAAIVGLKVKNLHFPAEQDEFDGPAQRQAIRDMALLRLLEGNIDAVERLSDIAMKKDVRTSDDTPMMEEILNAMQPHANTRGAWIEVREAIERWVKQRPSSVYAKLAQARYFIHCAIGCQKREDQPGQREYSEKAQAIIEKLPSDNPCWYMSLLITKVYAHRPVTETMETLRDALLHYPDYSPLHKFFGRAFARGGGDGEAVCANFIDGLVKQGQVEHAAQVLRYIHQSGLLEQMMPWLNSESIRACLAAGLLRWETSCEVRSELSFIAVTLGHRDIALLGMAKMAGKWDRSTWYGREELARELSRPREAPKPARLLVQ